MFSFMKGQLAVPRYAYPRMDEIDRLFLARFGLGDNTDDKKSAILGLRGPLTFYRHRNGIGKLPDRREMCASSKFMTAVLTTFDDVPFRQLFDPRDEVL